MNQAAPIGWLGIIRLGLVQTALGAVVVLTTSTMNRVMVVELALPAMLPGALVALHYAIETLRPRWGYGSDVGGRRTPWIIGGMAVLSTGGALAAIATAWMGTSTLGGVLLALLAFVMIGAGVGAAGTALLVLLAQRAHPDRRAAAASTVWIMMIAGFVITANTASYFLDPYSPERLVTVTAIVAALAFFTALLAVRGMEPEAASTASQPATAKEPHTPFMQAMAEVWREPAARRFAVFVFVSMLAYNVQDLILEPYAGLVFGFTVGESTRLAGTQHGGVLLGMLLVGVGGSALGGRRRISMRTWTIGGCIASGLALLSLALGGLVGEAFPLRLAVFALGLSNGAFAVAAIGSMMGLVSSGRERREGVRMGLWGAAQAIAFGLGGFLGTAAVDLTRALFGAPLVAYSTVFALEGLTFLIAARLAARVGRTLQEDTAPAAAMAPVDRYVPEPGRG